MTLRTAIAIRNAELDAGPGTQADNGYIRIYSGGGPAHPEDAPTGTLLAELRFGADAFPAAAAGVLTANAITPDAAADNTGTAGWFRTLKSDGSTPIFDGSVTAIGGGGDCQLDNINIQAGADVVIDSLTYSLPE